MTPKEWLCRYKNSQLIQRKLNFNKKKYELRFIAWSNSLNNYKNNNQIPPDFIWKWNSATQKNKGLITWRHCSKQSKVNFANLNEKMFQEKKKKKIRTTMKCFKSFSSSSNWRCNNCWDLFFRLYFFSST